MIFNGGVIRAIQPMTPETGVIEPLVLTPVAPGTHFHATFGWPMVSNGLEGRQQVIICGQHHTDVVGALECKSDEIDGQGYIDSFFLGPSLLVSELSLYHRSPGQLPALALLSMGSEGADIHFRVRAP